MQTMNKYLSILALMLILSSLPISNSYSEDGHDHEESSESDYQESNESDHEENSAIINDIAAKKAGIKIERAGSQTVYSTASLTGRIILNQDNTYDIKARFPGIVRSLKVKWGQEVKRGQVLATIESNNSLRTYSVTSPRDGIVLERNTNIGDVTSDASLFKVSNLSTVWAEFHVFPHDISKVNDGQKISVQTLGNNIKAEGKISMILPTADSDSQTIIAIVILPNSESKWRPGMTVEGKVQILKKEAPIAIANSAIQRMENETVVFVKEGDKYEARHVILGKGDGEYIEVLEGLNKDENYVSQGSFIVKADILKSSASHSH